MTVVSRAVGVPGPGEGGGARGQGCFQAVSLKGLGKGTFREGGRAGREGQVGRLRRRRWSGGLPGLGRAGPTPRHGLDHDILGERIPARDR